MNNENKNNKNTKKVVVALVALVAVIAILVGVYSLTKKEPVEGQKTITVEIIHGEGEDKVVEIETTREYLGEALVDEALIEGEDGPYGIYIKTVDGETVDDANQEWWCLTKNEGTLETSADQTPIEDGDKYELTFTVGY